MNECSFIYQKAIFCVKKKMHISSNFILYYFKSSCYIRKIKYECGTTLFSGCEIEMSTYSSVFLQGEFAICSDVRFEKSFTVKRLCKPFFCAEISFQHSGL